MAQEMFKIVFAGRLVAGADADVVRRNFQQLFKADAARVARLFTGKRVVIKKNVDEPTARKYQATLRKIGAICEVEPLGPPPAAADTGVYKAVSDAAVKAATGRRAATEPAAAPPEPPPAPPAVDFDLGVATAPAEWTLEAPGADLRDPAAARAAPPPPDTGDLSLAPPGADIVEPRPAPPQFSADLDDVTLAPVGSDLLPEAAKAPPPPPDTGDLSLAPPGSDLKQAKKKAPPPPDTGDLKLED